MVEIMYGLISAAIGIGCFISGFFLAWYIDDREEKRGQTPVRSVDIDLSEEEEKRLQKARETDDAYHDMFTTGMDIVNGESSIYE